MTYLVPYDSSDHAKAALYRAGEYAAALDHDVIAVTVVPRDRDYAREKGWIEADESFDVEAIEAQLREEIRAFVPDARHRCLSIGRFNKRGTIGRRIRRVASDADADVLVVGSENAGRILTPAASVGGSVTSTRAHDVFIVRTLPDDPAFRERL